MSATDLRSWLAELLVLLGGMLIIVAPALYSGFPLLYQDTGAYLATAFEGTIPLGRPVSYGWFIDYAGPGDSLWGAIWAQGLIMSYLIRRTVRVVMGAKAKASSYLLFLAVLVLFSGLGWYSAQLMPDIFAPAMLLLVFLILYDPMARWYHRLGWTVLVWGAAFAHYSHVSLGISLVVLLGGWQAWLIWRRGKEKRVLIRLLWPSMGILMAVVSLFAVNQANGYGMRMTRASHVFLTGRMVATGILGAYLDEVCPEKDWKLCPYKDELPISATAFIWSDKSPFKKTGYWKNSREEYSAMLSDLISRPKYLAWFALEGVEAGLQQILHVRVGDGIAPYRSNSSPWKFLERRMPAKLSAYQASRQAAGIDFTLINALQFLLFGGSVIVLFFALGEWKPRLSDGFFQLFLIVALGYLLNAFLTASLGNTYDRLQARMVWLVILLGMLALQQVLSARRSGS